MPDDWEESRRSVTLEEAILRTFLSPAGTLVVMDELHDTGAVGRCWICDEEGWGIASGDRRICPACCWEAHAISEEPRPWSKPGRFPEVVVDAAGNPRWDVRRWRD